MEKATKEQSRERLLKLADFLEKLPEEKFYYGSFFSKDGEEYGAGAPELESSCGSTACALGWACVMPDFKGLGLDLYESVSAFGGKTYLLPIDTLNRRTSFGAAERIFGLTNHESHYLFDPLTDLVKDSDDDDREYITVDENYSPDASATPKEVAAHIRRFVELYRS